MASFSSPKNAPVRSISLPTRLNPHSINIEAKLNNLKTWENSLISANSVSADIIRTGLVGLAELYNCLEELVHSPLTQQALTQYQNGKLIEEALEASIGLLDSSTTARDLSSMLKDNVRNLQSVFRRKGGVLSIESGSNAYLSCKKKVKRESAKSLRVLKQMENITGYCVLFDVNPYLLMVIRVLREVASITVSVLRFVFSFLSVQATKTKPSRWSLISNLMVKSSSKTNDKIFNELQGVDVAMQKSDVDVTRQRLEALDHGLEGLEDGLDCLFRRLIQNRVSLLNILVQ